MGHRAQRRAGQSEGCPGCVTSGGRQLNVKKIRFDRFVFRNTKLVVVVVSSVERYLCSQQLLLEGERTPSLHRPRYAPLPRVSPCQLQEQQAFDVCVKVSVRPPLFLLRIARV